MLGSLLGSLVGTAGSTSTASSSTTSPRSESPATSTSQDSTAPSTPAEPTEPPSESVSEGTGTTEEEEDPFQRSVFFQRLKTKGRHHRNRIKEIQERALKDTPPKEPDPWECCGGSCGIECVVSPVPPFVSFLLRSRVR